MAKDDILDHARSTIDYYALLSVPPTASESEIKRAYRRTALIHHPDKGGDREKFELLEVAKNVLTDETAKAIYDQGIAAKLQKAKNDAVFEGKRRAMKEDLERREREGATTFSGTHKRAREEDDVEVERKRVLERVREAGKRRRLAEEEAKRAAELRTGATKDIHVQAARPSTPDISTLTPKQATPIRRDMDSRIDDIDNDDAQEDLRRERELEALIEEKKAAKEKKKAEKQARKSGIFTSDSDSPLQGGSKTSNRPFIPSDLFTSSKADTYSAATPPPKFASFASSPSVPTPSNSKKDDEWEATYEKLRQAEKNRLIAELKAQEAAAES